MEPILAAIALKAALLRVMESKAAIVEMHAAAIEQEAEPEEPMYGEAYEEPYWEPTYYEPTYYWEPTYYEPSYESGDAPDLMSAGVVYDEGTRYTWYSQQTLPGGGLTELNANGRTVDGQGFVTDGDGRIAVASQDPIGTVLDTPWGEAVVYDYCETPGTVDVYTNWG